MFLSLRRTVKCPSTLTKLKFNISIDENYTKAVELHRAILATRIIKLIKKNPYEALQNPEDFLNCNRS